MQHRRQRAHLAQQTRKAASGRRGLRPVLHLFLASTLIAVTVTAGAARADEPALRGDAYAELVRLFDVAEAAYSKKDYQAAYEAYQAAWALRQSYDIAGNLGSVEVKLGKLRDAAQHLSFSLRRFPPSARAAEREDLQGRLKRLQVKLGRVQVRVSVPGAEVLLNGAAIGTSPIDHDIFVDPGSSTIEAKREGYEDARVVVEAVEGSSQEATLTLAARPVPDKPCEACPSCPSCPAPVQMPPPPAPAAPQEASKLPAIVMGGVAVAGVVGGVVLLGASGADRSDAAAMANQIRGDNKDCVTSGSATFDTRCTQVESFAGASDAKHNAAVGMFVTGALAAAGSAGYLLFAPKRDPKPPQRSGLQVRVMPVISNDSGGVIVGGTF